MPVLTLQVAAGDSDGWYDSSSGCHRTDTTIQLGNYGGATGDGAFRFVSVPLSARHRIKQARLYLKSTTRLVEGPVALASNIRCDDTDDAANLITTCNPSDRSPTTAYSAAGTYGPDADEWFYLADFASAVQEVLDRPGWAVGNAICATVIVHTPGSGGQLTVYAYENASANAPKLVIDYEDYAQGAMI